VAQAFGGNLQSGSFRKVGRMAQFNVDAVVMTAAVLLKVYVTETETFALPGLPGVTETAFHFSSADDAMKFAERCMSEQLPARAYGSIVVVLHE
jgi:hypothetical protein